jgi:hypothetical protein
LAILSDNSGIAPVIFAHLSWMPANCRSPTRIFSKELSMFPSSVLSKLYVKGSLKNTDQGFELAIKNMIDSAVLSGVGPIIVDGKTYDSPQLRLMVDNQERRGDQVTSADPLPMYFGRQLCIYVDGERLQPGDHQVVVNANTREIGRVTLDFTDSLA